MFEMIIAISLVVLLYVTVIERLLPLRGDAEAANVATVAGTLRSALGLEVADRLVHGEIVRVAELEGINPMRLLAEAPTNYLGEVNGVDPIHLPRGNWYFDGATGELAYLVRYTEYFRTELPGPPRIVFRVAVVHNDRGQVGGVRLDRVNEFVWTRSAELAQMLREDGLGGEVR